MCAYHLIQYQYIEAEAKLPPFHKIAAISNAFSLMKMYEFRLRFH